MLQTTLCQFNVRLKMVGMCAKFRCLWIYLFSDNKDLSVYEIIKFSVCTKQRYKLLFYTGGLFSILHRWIIFYFTPVDYFLFYTGGLLGNCWGIRSTFPWLWFGEPRHNPLWQIHWTSERVRLRVSSRNLNNKLLFFPLKELLYNRL